MVASRHGPPSPTTRHLLLTLSIYMDADGGSCFPSTRALVESTGLSERSVCTHLELAAKDGWIEKVSREMKGQRWRHHQYDPLFPSKVLKEVQHLEAEGTEPDAQGAEPLSEGTEPDDVKVLKEVQSTISVTNPITTPEDQQAGGGSNGFEIFFQAYPKKRLRDRINAKKAWDACADRPPLDELLATLERWKKTEQWQKEGGRFITSITNWIADRRWEERIAVSSDLADMVMAEKRRRGLP